MSLGFGSWFADKVTDTASATLSIGVGIAQPITENVLQAGTAVGTAAGGTLTTVTGLAATGVGEVLEGAGLSDGEMADKGRILTQVGVGATEGSLDQMQDAVQDTFSMDGEVAAGLAHAGGNMQSIMFDWSEDDMGYMPYVGEVDYDAVRKENLDAMASDETGWDGDTLLGAVFQTIIGAPADAWTHAVDTGYERGSAEEEFLGYENWLDRYTDEERRAFIGRFSETVIGICIGVGVLAKIGGISKLKNWWTGAGYASRAGFLLASAMVAGTKLPNFDILSGMEIVNNDDGDTDGRGDEDADPVTDPPPPPPPEPDPEPQDPEDPVNPYGEDEDQEVMEEDQYGRHPTEAEKAELTRLADEARQAAADKANMATNPYVESEAVW